MSASRSSLLSANLVPIARFCSGGQRAAQIEARASTGMSLGASWGLLGPLGGLLGPLGVFRDLVRPSGTSWGHLGPRWPSREAARFTKARGGRGGSGSSLGFWEPSPPLAGVPPSTCSPAGCCPLTPDKSDVEFGQPDEIGNKRVCRVWSARRNRQQESHNQQRSLVAGRSVGIRIAILQQ
jgi:hypothetical protein